MTYDLINEDFLELVKDRRRWRRLLCKAKRRYWLVILDYTERGDMKTFSEKVYDLLRQVPKGRVTTYKEIGHGLETKAYRSVGQAMKRNPYAPEVP